MRLGMTRTRISVVNAWQSVPRSAACSSPERFIVNRECRIEPPDLAHISPSRNSRRTSAARWRARYSCSVTLLTGFDAIPCCQFTFPPTWRLHQHSVHTSVNAARRSACATLPGLSFPGLDYLSWVWIVFRGSGLSFLGLDYLWWVWIVFPQASHLSALVTRRV